MSFNNPYEVLGVSETDSIEQIEMAYKGFMKILHPDKANTPEAKRLGMTQDEKMRYLSLIVESYKTIKETYRDRRYPDTKQTYKVDQDHTIKFNHGLTENDAKNFNSSKFNNIFDTGLQRDMDAGMSDPFKRGYNDFDTGKDFSENNNTKVVAQTYSGTISVENSKNTKAPKMKDNRLTEYIPDTTSFFDSSSNYQELGLTNISDFSMTIQGKGSIHGTDLMSAYGNNMEPWEHTVKKDAALYAKYNDDEDITSKSNKIKTDRANIYNLPVDQNMANDLKKYNERIAKKEIKRISNMGVRDEYYNSLNQGRLEDGNLPSRS